MESLRTAREVLCELLSSYCGHPVEAHTLQPITSGASGRCIMRAEGVLAIYWTADRADNNAFLPAAHGLARAGVPVPKILAERTLPHGCGACLVSDLGTCELLSLKHTDWPTRKAAYRASFRTLLKLYATQPDWPLQPPFDEDMYRWEQRYFAEHLLERHLGRNAEAFLAAEPLRTMAAWLSTLPRVPIHRDCQSPNIMLHDGVAWLVDFQGMRMGLKEYDLASLLFDSHMPLQPHERRELLDLWETLSGESVSMELFCACAMQRIMQALGAYGNIGYNQHKPQYLELIPIALQALSEAADMAPDGSYAKRIIPWLPVKKR